MMSGTAKEGLAGASDLQAQEGDAARKILAMTSATPGLGFTFSTSQAGFAQVHPAGPLSQGC